MNFVNQIATVTALLLSQPALADEGRIGMLDEGELILCSTYSAIQTMYALVAENRVENLSGCWVANAPLEFIILQRGERLSSITYREFQGDDVIARLLANGAPQTVINRVRDNPWTPWSQSPTWAFTAWLGTSR